MEKISHHDDEKDTWVTNHVHDVIYLWPVRFISPTTPMIMVRQLLPTRNAVASLLVHAYMYDGSTILLEMEMWICYHVWHSQSSTGEGESSHILTYRVP
eukprot:scaffold5547_cov163-Amphora_coffeaeformis.AAC.7